MADTLPDRIARAEAMITKSRSLAERHHADAKVHVARGRHASAAESSRLAETQEVLAKKHEMDLRRLQAKSKGQSARVVYAQVAKEQAQERRGTAPRPDPLVVYGEALARVDEIRNEAEMLRKKAEGYGRQGDTKKRDRALARAASVEGFIAQWMQAAQDEVESSGRDLHREYALTKRAQARHDTRTLADNARLERLGADMDERTAAGQRLYRNPNATNEYTTSLAIYEALIVLPKERTERRLAALRRFDTLCQTAEAGLFPEPKFEAESRGGAGAPGQNVTIARMAGVEELREIEDVVGGANVAMLRAWVSERQTNAQLLRQGFGTEKTISRLCLSALDAVAVYWRTGDALKARLAGNTTASREAA